jgi:LCP family protein required for cell wall assembly
MVIILPMSDEMFKRPSVQPGNDSTPPERANHNPDSTIKNNIVPDLPAAPETDSQIIGPSSQSSRPWQDIPAVKMYEMPYDQPKSQASAYVARDRAGTPPPPPSISRESAARVRARRRRSRKTRGTEWAWVIVAGALFFIVIIIGMSGVLLIQNGGLEQEIIPTATLNVAMLPPPVDLRGVGDPGASSNGDLIVLEDGTEIELKKWDAESRFTILFMGVDRRPGDSSIAHLTDTMMLISIDPRTNSIGVLSIPRDLYVQVPGYSELQRINTPMVLGEIRQPGLGPSLAMQTVQYNLGIRVNEYVLMDFQAAIDLVNAIGGIEVTTDYTINDTYYPDMYYGYDPFYLAAGTHQLNGETALKFARTRHGDNDLERARRQQQVLYAVRDRVLSFDMIPNLIIQAPTLLTSLDDNFYTGLSLQEMIELALFAKDVAPENIITNVIDYGYVSNYTTARGDQVLIPNRNALGSLMVETFGADYSQ